MYAEECLPGLYVHWEGLFTNGIRTAEPVAAWYYYCKNKKYGGGLHTNTLHHPRDMCDETWRWNGGCKSTDANCPCSSHHCETPKSMYCFCAMGGHWSNMAHEYCFQERGSCFDEARSCKIGEVLKECGCFKNGTRITNTENDGTALNSKSSENELAYNCYPGICVACPKGYKCFDKNYAMPCPQGTYQDQEGQVECKPCNCPPGQYKMTPFVCDPVRGPFASCANCDACSDQDECRGARNHRHQTHPTRGHCWICENTRCNHPDYFRGESNSNYCYFQDVHRSQCKPQYFDKNIEDNDETPRREDFQNDWDTSLRRDGPIPWKGGYKRTKPIRPHAITGPNSGESRGYPGQLPYYTKCVNFNLALPYKWTTDQTRKNFLNQMNSWDSDCIRTYAQDCDNAVAEYFDLAKTELRSCTSCPQPSTYENGECVCREKGTIRLSKLRDTILFGDFFRAYPNNENEACYDCRPSATAKGFTWRKAAGIIVNEAIRCAPVPDMNPLNVLPQTPYQYLDTNHEWQACPNGYIPDLSRTGCIQCEQGEYPKHKYPTLINDPRLARLECAPCPSGYYQDAKGQSECKQKKTNCTKTLQIKMNGDDNVTHDNECVPCETSCKPNEIQIYMDNKNDTCDGAGLSYFGCMPWSNIVDFPMNVRLKYTSTNTGSPSIRHEECSSANLPLHSYFVKVPQNGLNGRQCYFACLHGVDPIQQQIIHSLEVQYTQNNNTQLTKFAVDQLPILGNQNPQSKIKIQSEEIPRDFQNIETNNIELGSWIDKNHERSVSSLCPLCSTAWKKNTFLMIDALWNSNRDNYQRLCLNDSVAYNPCPQQLLSSLDKTRDYAKKDNMDKADLRGSYIKCAYDARDSLISFHDRQDVKHHSVQSKLTLTELCRLETSNTDEDQDNSTTPSDSNLELRSWDRVGCTRHCLDEEQRKAKNVRLKLPISNNHRLLVSQIEDFLARETWHSIRQYPYEFNTNGSCSFSCTGQTVKVDLKRDIPSASIDLKACFSCDENLKEACRLKGQILKTQLCNEPDKTQWTLDDVCHSCTDDKLGATYLGDETNSTWLSDRTSKGYPENEWHNTQCKYNCVPGYYPNDVKNNYQQNPCISCVDTIATLCTGSTFNASQTAYFKQKPEHCASGAVQTYQGVKCNTCNNHWSTINDIIKSGLAFFSPGIYEDAYACSAKCHENDYHSFDAGEADWISKPPTTNFVPIQNLRCMNCSDHPQYSCSGVCASGRFLHPVSDKCDKCNTTICPQPDLYREQCPGGNRSTDAGCISCSSNYLYNQIISDRTSLIPKTHNLWLSIQSTQNQKTRKYVTLTSTDQSLPVLYVPNIPNISLEAQRTSGRAAYQCILACQNNYVWIDITTWQSPFVATGLQPLLYDHEKHFCLPCNSDFFKSETLKSPNSITLYSVWNEFGNSSLVLSDLQDGTSEKALYKMHTQPMGRDNKGGCYRCALPEDQITESDTKLCVTKPGRCTDERCVVNNTVLQEQSSGMLTTLNASALVVPNQPNTPIRGPVAQANNRNPSLRRRLLQMGTQALPSDNPAATPQIFSKIKRRAFKLPVQAAGDTPVCCAYTQGTSDQNNEKCKGMRSWEIQSKISLTGANLNDDFCTSFKLQYINNKKTGDNALAVTQNTRRTRNLLQFNTDTSLQAQSTTGDRNNNTIEFAEESPYKCPIGQYKEGYGDGSRCTPCPAGASTTAPFYTSATSMESCYCQLGYKQTKRGKNIDGTFELECKPCGFNFYRNNDPSLFPSNLNETTYCLPCQDGMETRTATSSECFCKPGSYLQDSTCLPCPPGFYCAQGEKIACPPFSTSNGFTSKRGHCICTGRTHYGDLSEPNSLCIEIPPGIRCQDGSWDCVCADGWTKVTDPFDERRARCISSCKIGEYITVSEKDNTVSTQCRPCPINTYSDTRNAIGSEEEICKPCPTNTFTKKEGSSNITDCICETPATVKGMDSRECGICPKAYYMDNETKICTACPSPLISEKGSVGKMACKMCPPGFQSYKRTSSSVGSFDFEYACELCPLGEFSSRIGISCTPCPLGFATLEKGATSMAKCVRL